MKLHSREKTVYFIQKRLFDVVLSSILLFLLLPILLIIYLMIKIQEPGPAIFKQKRLGKDGQLFDILKFRTMKIHAPSIAAAEICEEDYVTELGRLLRRTSLDELPQLLNILKGEMSFVGPRPLIPNEGSINDRRRELGIHKLRPGLTGWAQVIARDTSNQDQKLELDIYYKTHKSLALDLKIMFMTFFTMVHDKEDGKQKQ